MKKLTIEAISQAVGGKLSGNPAIEITGVPKGLDIRAWVGHCQRALSMESAGYGNRIEIWTMGGVMEPPQLPKKCNSTNRVTLNGVAQKP